MFHKKWKKQFLLFCALAFLLSACSYKELEDSLKRKLNTDEDQYVNDTKIPDENSETPEEEKKVYTIGDTVRISYPTEDAGTTEYTLIDSHLSSNIQDVGLTNSDFENQSLLDKDGNIDSKFQLLTLEFTVKNINAKGKEPGSQVPIISIESSIAFKSWIEDPDGPWTIENVYFSHGIIDEENENKELKWQSYSYFPLDIGDKVDVIVGWFVPVEQIDTEPLYHIIGSFGATENYKYFELEF